MDKNPIRTIHPSRGPGSEKALRQLREQKLTVPAAQTAGVLGFSGTVLKEGTLTHSHKKSLQVLCPCPYSYANFSSLSVTCARSRRAWEHPSHGTSHNKGCKIWGILTESSQLTE